MVTKPYDCIIIGSGPAGLTAAIYSVRAGRSTLVVSGPLPGGQLMLTDLVEDYPGFPEPVKGSELMDRMRKQAENLGVKFISGSATEVEFKEKPFVVFVDGNPVKGKTVIIASGASAKTLGIPSEWKFMGKGVSTCAVCDAFFYKGKDIVVVGGGDSAMREALFCSKICKTVTVIHRRDKLKAQKVLQDRAFATKNIKWVWNTEVKDFIGKDKLDAIKLLNNKTKKETTMKIDGVFIAIGHRPNTDIYKGQLELDEKGYIAVKDRTKTSVHGVFASGDVHDYMYMQAVTAAGAGCMAALDANEFLQGDEK
ncbi:MAG: thioredoxin-disulfide reductase [Candidatus Aenigmarchaeota archaeon]|nr:thioredoxin-disulfide reductase [Candidatus Aenigmarchaeota archaeon]